MSPSTSDPALSAIDAYISQAGIDTNASGWRNKLPRPPEVNFDAGVEYRWKLTTSEGEMSIKLLSDVAPKHVASTAYLTRLGFYDGLSFHRVIEGFMAQGGCPLGSGTGGPGYTYAGEFSPNVKHDKPGLLSMANAGPNTDGSQFFITFVPTPHLDGMHTIFGQVVDGLDTVSALESKGSRSGTPKAPMTITKAEIEVIG